MVNYGYALLQQKQYEAAAKVFQEELQKEDSAVNNYNVGELLFETQHYKQAAIFLEKAIQKDQRTIKYRTKLSEAMYKSNQYAQAFLCLYEVLKLEPNNSFVAGQLSILTQYINVLSFSPLYKEALAACLKIENIDHHNFFYFWHSLFTLDPEYKVLQDYIALQDYEQFKERFDIALAVTLLTQDFCTYGIRLVPNYTVRYEAFLSHMRRRFLDFFMEPESAALQEKQFKLAFQLLCVMGENFFMHEYLAAETPEESEGLKLLKTQIQSGAGADPWGAAARFALLSCYEPLYKLDGHFIALALALPGYLPDFWKNLLHLQIEEPRQEQSLRQTIPAIGRMKNEISVKVREQYEENPYPRWRYANAQVQEDKSLSFKKGYDILIAGCGTGKQVVQDCFMYPHARITAIDLSLSSISYAKRKVVDLGLKNVEFYHADILELGALDKKFDFIMCSGVLHHMQNPDDGMTVLLSLLKPKGLMNIGLYSEYARKKVVELRKLIQERGWSSDKQGIQAFRHYIHTLPTHDALSQISEWRDYYSMSTVRDLVFHVQEHRYTFLDLEDMLQRHGLAFVDFSFVSPQALALFKKEYPEKQHFRDFKLWDHFEKRNPTSFGRMYQLWLCRKEFLADILAGPKIIDGSETR